MNASSNIVRARAAVSAIALITGLLAAAPVQAQAADPQTPAPAAADADKPEAELIVTGSRAITNGYQAPTPVSVLSAAALNAIAPTNIADAVDRLPALMSSPTPRSKNNSISAGIIGASQLNLRGLGTPRTLVLFDGKRIINSSANTALAAPDVSTIPIGIIARTDVVTGGASAAYGSDAVSGVVNFVIDRNFTGLKASLQGGVTTYGDDESYLGTLTIGKKFAGGRGHILLAGEYAYNAGIKGTHRPWNDVSANVATNPAYTATNGLPFLILARQVGLSNGTPGGLITSGPLRGTVFGPGGTPGVFTFGAISSNNLMIGGDWQTSRIDDGLDLDPRVKRLATYGRIGFDVTDNFRVYAEGQWATTNSNSIATPNRRLANLTISTTNPFIPAAIASRLTTLGQTSFVMGTTNGDIGRVRVNNDRTLKRWTVGAEGSFGLVGSDWKWDVSYQQSREKVISRAGNNGITANYLLAVDAVRDPNTNAIVCRSTLTNPTNGCVAYNPFGTGVNDPRAIAYVTGTAKREDDLQQDVAAANLRGEPFSTWAGPVSVALGIEHRREAVGGVATALDEANAFFTGNYHATHGSYHVTEEFAEAVVPLAKDASWAKSLDLNGAVRFTDYSLSGNVVTWKVGGVYAPLSDIRFRASHSRDIRAPNLGDLFSGGQTQSGQSVIDRFNGNVTTSGTFRLTTGNPNLSPEKADTNEVGVVLSPSFIPGLQASVDYYSISIKGAIFIPSAQNVIDLCFAGQTGFCQYITRATSAPTSAITLVTTPSLNASSQKERGLDFDVSYHLPLNSIDSSLHGALQLHGAATYVITLKRSDITGVTEGAGVLGSYTTLANTSLTSPKFQSMVSAGYGDDGFDFTATWRHVGGGVYDHNLIACTSACPAGTNTISGNTIAASNLIDLAFAVRPFASNRGIELFGTVDNVFNKAPPLIYGVTSDGYYQGQSNFDYDRIGRSFRAGVRVRM